MSITNISKPTTTFANQTRINIGEIWNTDLNTWAAESRTWDEMASLIDNYSKPTTTFTNVAKP